MWGVCITLDQDSSFTYVENTCTLTLLGKGKYQIQEDHITLHYDSVENQKVVYTTNTTNSIALIISALDDKSGTILDTIVLYQLNAEGEYDSVPTTYHQGRHFYKVRMDGLMIFAISSPHYSTQNFSARKPGVYEIYAELSDAHSLELEYIQGVENYIFKQGLEAEWTLIDKNGWERSFKKR